ncbi:hybrid sensor histidine kinase/response regulator, partial [uncultured Clostridium sp.]|uniref:ligand-binding sensor domain-containing protein n=1 Tax=uncultured Clostridium sp. TaxID=59620 RepID=UPI00260D6310
MKFKILILVIFFNILIYLQPQAEVLIRNNFEKVSIDEGLSNNYVTCIFQDSKGYMWIGTEDGLNRYDGKTVKVYNCNNKNKNSLSSTYITDLTEDFLGNIWIGTDDGLDVLLTDTDTVIKVNDLNDGWNLKINSLLSSIYEESVIWVGTENGLMKIDVKNKTIDKLYHEDGNVNSLSSSSVTCFQEDEDGTLWVGTKLGINVVDKNLNVYPSNFGNKLYITDIEKDSYGNIFIISKDIIILYNINEDKRIFLYVLNSEGLRRYNLIERKLEDIFIIKDKRVNFYKNIIFSEREDGIWLSSTLGAIRYSRNKGTINLFKRDSSVENTISSNIITCFCEDKNGVIWIGTDKGVNILNSNTVFNYINKEEFQNVVSMVEQGEYIWIATKFKGIYIYNKNNGELVNKLYDENKFTFSDRYIKELFKMNDDYVIISTNKELICLNIKNYGYENAEVYDYSSSELNYIYNDGEKVWIATTEGFYSYNIKTGEKVYYNEEIKMCGVNPKHIKYIVPDNKDKNIIWLGGSNTGLIRYDKQNGIIDIYVNDPLNKNSLISNYITCMIFDENDNLWIGSNVGLSKFETKTKKFTTYTTSEGLTNNFINSILIDNNNDIWTSTNKGLNKLNVENNKFTNYSKMDGLYGYQFNLNSSLKLSDGSILFGSTEGLTYFNINDLVNHSRNKDKVVIGDIFIGKDKVVYNEKELVLKHDYKDLSINYFLPNYAGINNITYEYMLQGIDNEWTYIDSKNSLDIKSLEPGKYNLKIRARGGNGELTDETIINIRVKNPIWKTPLAYLVYFITLLIVFIYIFNYVKILRHLVDKKTMNLKNQLDENKRLSQKLIEYEKFKNNYFVNLSHELRTPINVVNSTVQLIDLLNSNEGITKEKLNSYMGIISRSCNNLL